MKYTKFVGPLALVLAFALFAWGTIDPVGRGYGMFIFLLLQISMLSGVLMAKEAKSTTLRTIAWACVSIPIALMILFIMFLTALAIGSKA